MPIHDAITRHETGIPHVVIDPETGERYRIYYRPIAGNHAYFAERARLLEPHQRQRWAEVAASQGGEDSPATAAGEDDQMSLLRQAIGNAQREKLLEKQAKLPTALETMYALPALAGTVLAGWEIEGLPSRDDQGRIHRENACRLLELPWVYRQLMAAAAGGDQVLEHEKEVAEKKSSATSRGSSGGAARSKRPKRASRSATTSTRRK